MCTLEQRKWFKQDKCMMIKKSIHQEDTAILNNPKQYKMYQTTKLQICEAKTDRNERRNKQIHNYRWRFKYFLSSIDRNIRMSVNINNLTGWGYSSVGRVLASHAQGPGFNPQHHKKKNPKDPSLFSSLVLLLNKELW